MLRQYSRLPMAVIFDIDGTLADCSHRQHLVNHGDYSDLNKSNWKEFFRLIPSDRPVDTIVRLLNILKVDNEIVLCTGRGEEHRQPTEVWLNQYRIDYNALYMRPANNTQPDDEIKASLLCAIREEYTPWLVIDDRNKVVDMWRENGLTCLQCAPGDF